MRSLGKKGIADKMLYQVIVFILGAIGLLVLFYVGYMLFNLLTDSGDAKIANDVMMDIVERMNLLKDGEQDQVMIVAPEGYALMVSDGAIATCDHALISRGNILTKYKDRFEGCFKEGSGAIVLYELKSDNRCIYGFGGCFNYRDLPIEIFFYKDGNVIVFSNESIEVEKKKDDIVVETDDEVNLIDGIIKRNESFMNLTKKYIDGTYRVNGAEIEPVSDENNFYNLTNIKDELEAIIKGYLNNETLSNQVSNERWSFSLYQLDQSQVIRIVLRIYGNDYDSIIKKKDYRSGLDHDEKSFEIVLTVEDEGII